jgi:ADP-ribose pyrophosphatase
MSDQGIISRRLIHKGRKFDFEQVVVAGASGEPIAREVVRHPGAVVVVPVLEDGGGPGGGGGGARLVMIRNRRVAVGETLLEFPAGTLDEGERPEACAGRELAEETGYEARGVVALGWFYTTPGLTDERMHAFVATGLREVGQRLEEDESITVEVLPAAEVLRRVDAGELRDGKSIVALFLAMRRGLVGAAGR